MRGAPINYSADQLAFIEQNKVMPRRELATLVNDTFGTNYSYENIKSLCTRNKWNTGRTGCFEKGHKTWNKGTKGYTSANKTSFKKGNKPANHLPVGTERVNSDGYREIKVAEGKHQWRLKQRLVWEKHHKVKLVRDEVIRFKDGDRLNCNIENLEKFSMSENAYLNMMKVNTMPEEVRPAAKTIARIQARSHYLEEKSC